MASETPVGYVHRFGLLNYTASRQCPPTFTLVDRKTGLFYEVDQSHFRLLEQDTGRKKRSLSVHGYQQIYDLTEAEAIERGIFSEEMKERGREGAWQAFDNMMLAVYLEDAKDGNVQLLSSKAAEGRDVI